MRVSTMRYRKYWKAENRMGEAEKCWNERKLRAASEAAFEESGCKADCEETYRKFIGLRFTYTWKEIQARNGYILHDLHLDDIPVEMITTDSSQAGADAEKRSGSSREITENILVFGKWNDRREYCFGEKNTGGKKPRGNNYEENGVQRGSGYERSCG